MNESKGISFIKKEEMMMQLKRATFEKNLKVRSIDKADKISKSTIRSTELNSQNVTKTPANIITSAPRSISPIVSKLSSNVAAFSGTVKKKVSQANDTITSTPSSPSLSAHSPHTPSTICPISKFTFGESSSGTSIDAQTENSKSESLQKNSDLNKPKLSTSPKCELKRSGSNRASGKSSPLTQRALKQLRWCSTSKKTSGSYLNRKKLSREDSMMTTLMSSLDQVPELGGHLDMDSTSCSLCSSGDDDPPSMPRGQSPSSFPMPPIFSNTNSFSDIVLKPRSLSQENDRDDDTLGSNSDYTIEGELDRDCSAIDEAPDNERLHCLISSVPGSRIANYNLSSRLEENLSELNSNSDENKDLYDENRLHANLSPVLHSSSHQNLASASLDSKSHESDQTVIDLSEAVCSDISKDNSCKDNEKGSQSEISTFSSLQEVKESQSIPNKCQSLSELTQLSQSSQSMPTSTFESQRESPLPDS